MIKRLQRGGASWVVTINDVAKHAGVSIATVSRVLHGVESVNKVLANKVNNAMEDLGYVPNTLAQSLKQNCSHMIGITASDLSVAFFPEVVKGIEKTFLPKGYATIVSNTYDQSQIERSVLEHMMSRRVDALLVNSSGSNEKLLKKIEESGTPVIFYDRRPIEDVFPIVSADKKMAMEIALEHLCAQGHKRVMLVTGPRSLSSNYDRYMGVQRFIFRNDLDPVDFSFHFGEFSQEDGARAVEEAMNLPAEKRPTAIITGSIAITAGIMAYCRAHNISMPEDMALVSSGTFMYEQAMECHLTYLDDCVRELTTEIIGMLDRCLNGEVLTQNDKSFLQPILHIGSTT